MTAEQKTQLASFLDLTADTLRGGYAREREPWVFTDDSAPVLPPAPQAGAEGGARPLLMLIGEGLEAGGSAELLDRMLASIGLFRGKNCVSGGEEQIGVLKPRMILCLGSTAQVQDFPGIDGETIPLLTTYHPEELLQNASLKRPAWEDLKTLRAKLMELDPLYAGSVTGRP
ncbi:hypothetical protein AGMMS49587_08200 [Spirochaetia bacterium]|nr:hypothetical protein AGMMS49587_08200 [Spirochaetia bacterium]